MESLAKRFTQLSKIEDETTRKIKLTDLMEGFERFMESLSKSPNSLFHTKPVIEIFGWAFPRMETLIEIEKLVKERKIISAYSIGSGKSFAEFLLSCVWNGKFVLSDPAYGDSENWKREGEGTFPISNSLVIPEKFEFGLFDYSEPSILMMVWPVMSKECHGEGGSDYSHQALIEFLQNSKEGSLYYYIGEGEGMCTGTLTMHRIMAHFMKTVHEGEVICFRQGIHDFVQVLERKYSKETLCILFQESESLITEEYFLERTSNKKESAKIWKILEDNNFLCGEETTVYTKEDIHKFGKLWFEVKKLGEEFYY
tara:strand:- start:859 stop:1794 length:936 start_codon:yes stop_codon:yes gene_type:complete